MASDNGQEIRAIAELATDIKYMRKEIDNLTKRFEEVATQEDIANLRKEIESNSPSHLFSTLTKLAAGIVTFAAAIGVIIAILKSFKAI